MGIQKLSLLVAAAVMALSAMGAVSAQSSTPTPNQQWQGQNWCRNNNNQNNNHNNNCDPNGWQSHNGQGSNYGNNNNRNDPNGWMRDHRDDRADHHGTFYYPNPYYYDYTAPGYPVITGDATTTTTIQTISQDAVLRHIIQIVADSLNLQSSDVTTQMTGSTLAAVITAHGGNVAAIQTQIITELTTWLNEIVSDGLITQASANTVLNDITNIVSRALNGQFTQTGTIVTGLVQ
ncbi:MAG TPA: hypothetical protein VHD90_09610 [Phototrophicaceae bacterium]|nr:hypothetical protein [Phototrophicaceae bacterium]